ncbi:YbaB/EbfC family nucleoid-associated protein [Caminibacter profundus]
MFGNLDLNEMMQKLQEQMQAADNKTYSAKSGGGLVEATVNGKFEVIDIKIDDSLLEDKEALQILLMSAVNDAIKMAVEDKKAQALNMFGGMNLGQ